MHARLGSYNKTAEHAKQQGKGAEERSCAGEQAGQGKGEVQAGHESSAAGQGSRARQGSRAGSTGQDSKAARQGKPGHVRAWEDLLVADKGEHWPDWLEQQSRRSREEAAAEAEAEELTSLEARCG